MTTLYLRSADFIKRDKYEGLHEAAQSYVAVEVERREEEEEELGQEGHQPYHEGEAGVLDQVKHVEVHREVVPSVPSGDVVEISFFQKHISIATYTKARR